MEFGEVLILRHQLSHASLALLPYFIYLKTLRFRSIWLPSTVQQSTVPSTTMDPETGIGREVADPSVDANRWKSRCKSTIVNIPQEVVKFTQLSNADRRLAEICYVQLLPLLPPYSIHRHSNIEHMIPKIRNGTARLTLQVEYHVVYER